MSPQRWFLILLALAVAGFGVRSCIAFASRSPHSLLESAKERLATQPPDWDGAFHELGLGYELARERGQLEVARKLLYQRALAYQQRLAHDFTLRDCRTILEELGPDLPSLELAVRTCVRIGAYDEGLELAEAMRAAFPEHELPLSMLGRVQMGRADAVLLEARGRLFQHLADGVAAGAMQLADQVAALEPGSSRYAAVLGRLRTVLPDGPLEEEVLRHVADATSYRELAREAFLTSLDVRVSPEGLDGLIELLDSAGDLEEAVGLGNVSLSFPRYRQRWGTVLRTAQGLVQLGRREEAKQLLGLKENSNVPFGKVPVADLAGWCALLYELEIWPRLAVAAGILQRSQEASERQVAEAGFYAGMAQLRRRDWAAALASLRAYATAGGQQIHEGARAEAWIGVAEASRRTARPAEERRALNALQRVSPRQARDEAQARLLGDAWLRLSELQAEEGQMALVEESLTHAMRYRPARMEDLLPRWRAAGEARMASFGRTFLLPSGLPRRSEPELDSGPHELLLFAEYHLAPVEGEPIPSRSSYYARRVLGAFPDFVPALDVLGRAHLAAGDGTRAAEAIVRQMEVAGARPELTERMLAIPAESIHGDLVQRWALRDPRAVLLGPFVDQLLEEERFDVALRTLASSRTDAPEPEQILLRKALLFERLDLPSSALELGLRLPLEGDALAEHGGLLLRAAAALPEGARAKGVGLAARRLLQAPALRDPELPRAVDQLQAAGLMEPAHRVLLHLDGMDNHWGGEVQLRLAVAEALLGNTEAAEEFVTRAEPFLAPRDVAVARAVLATAAGRPRALPIVAASLAPEDLGAGELDRALVAALRGRFADALDLALSAQEPPHAPSPLALLLQRACEAQVGRLAPPADDAPALERLQATLVSDLLHGYGELVRDPRETMVLLLAARDPVWSAWALQALRALPQRLRISPWPLLLEARALRSLGAVTEAKVVLRRLLRNGVTYAALELEDLIASTTVRPEDPLLLAVRAERELLFGDAGWTERERALVQAFRFELARKPRHALAVLEEAGRRQPDDPVLATLIGRKRADLGLVAEAVDAYQHLLEIVGVEGLAAVMPEYLAALHRAGTEGSISRAAWVAELEGLEALLPEEPMLAREIAARTLERFGPGSAEGFRRAWERLDAFRDRTNDLPIERLRRGEAQRWLELYATYDPDRATRFAREELLQAPTSLGLWWAYADSLARSGAREEALQVCGTVLQVSPDPRFERLTIELELALGRPAADVLRRIGALARGSSGKKGGPDPVALFQRARTLLRLSADDVRQAHGILAGLWAARSELRDAVDGVELGTVYGLALLEPGPLRSPARALEVVHSTLPFCRTAARRHFLRAFAAVAEQGMEEERAASAAGGKGPAEARPGQQKKRAPGAGAQGPGGGRAERKASEGRGAEEPEQPEEPAKQEKPKEPAKPPKRERRGAGAAGAGAAGG